MQQTLDLFEFGCALMRQNLKRSHPDASEEELRKKYQDWLWYHPLLWSENLSARENKGGE